jgi:predicted transcriptional regulator YdeE
MRKAVSISLLLAGAILIASLARRGEAGASNVRTEDTDGFTVVGIVVRTNNARETGAEGEIPKLWARAMQQGLLDQIPNRADKNMMVVNSDYASDEHGDYDYTLGVRVTSAEPVPVGFVVKRIQPGRYAVLRSEQGPPSQVVPRLWQKIWKMTPEELGGRRAYQTDFEVYAPPADPQNIEMEVHLGLKP